MKIYTRQKEYTISKDSDGFIYHFDFSNRKVEVTPNLFGGLYLELLALLNGVKYFSMS